MHYMHCNINSTYSGHSYFSTEGLVSPNVDSVVLERVKVHCGSDHVNITCLFRNDRSPTQQCVIVIRKLTESLLMVKHFSVDTGFPVNLLLSEPGNYTVAVFGWSDGIIESLPAQLQQADITGISKGNHSQVPFETYTPQSLLNIYKGMRLF